MLHKLVRYGLALTRDMSFFLYLTELPTATWCKAFKSFIFYKGMVKPQVSHFAFPVIHADVHAMVCCL